MRITPFPSSVSIRRPATRHSYTASSGRQTVDDVVQIGGNLEADEVARPTVAVKKSQLKEPLHLNRSDLERPLKDHRWLELLERINPELSLGDLKAELFKQDPKTESYTEFTLNREGGEGWEAIALKAKTDSELGEISTTSRVFRYNGEPSSIQTWTSLVSDHFPTLQQLPETLQKKWFTAFTQAPEAMLERVASRYGNLGPTKKHFIHFGLGNDSNASLHCQTVTGGRTYDLRMTKKETSLSAALDSEELGGSLPPLLRDGWDEWGLQPVQLCERILEGTGLSGRRVRVGVAERDGEEKATIGFDLHSDGEASGSETGHLSFEFRAKETKGRRQRSVYHQLIKLSEKQQGEGTAKRILANNFKLYDELQVDSVDLTAAMTVGGYAWARYGWQLNDEPKMHERVNKQLQSRLDSLELNSAARKVAQKLIDSKSNKKLWAISDLKQPVVKDGRETSLGKALLLGTNWQGTFAMKDHDSRKRLESYLGQ